MIAVNSFLFGKEQRGMEEIFKIKRAAGELTVPGDKSISHRGVMLGAIADGVTEISGFLMGADCLSTIECFRQMGVRTDVGDNTVTVYGVGMNGLKKPEGILYTGNSGTTTRLLAGLLSAQDFDCVITGDASICKRPMKRVTKPLSLMGAKIENEYCPLNIHGRRLKGIDYQMEVASAQVKTALILAALYADGKTVIHEKEKSRDHTELMLSAMGADITVNGLDITVGRTERLTAQKIEVPGDISSAAFFLVLGAVMPGSDVTVRNVGLNPTRTGIIDVLKNMGADMEILNERISAGERIGDIRVKSSALCSVEIGGDIIPRLIDELPVIAVAAAFADGKTVIRDAQELKVKETNRIDAVVTELKKCGVDIEAKPDGMVINGGADLHGADFKAYSDHRMAMSLAVLAQMIEEKCTIDDAECVKISYPGFYDDLKKLDN